MSSADPKVKIPRERLPYSAIVDRPKRKFPDGARVVVWPIVNVEDWDIERRHAARRNSGAHQSRRASRHCQLGMARVRHARRLLANQAGARQPRHSRLALHQRTRLRVLSSRRPGRARSQMGVRRPQLHTSPIFPASKISRQRFARPSRPSNASPDTVPRAG